MGPPGPPEPPFLPLPPARNGAPRRAGLSDPNLLRESPAPSRAASSHWPGAPRAPPISRPALGAGRSRVHAADLPWASPGPRSRSYSPGPTLRGRQRRAWGGAADAQRVGEGRVHAGQPPASPPRAWSRRWLRVAARKELVLVGMTVGKSLLTRRETNHNAEFPPLASHSTSAPPHTHTPKLLGKAPL